MKKGEKEMDKVMEEMKVIAVLVILQENQAKDDLLFQGVDAIMAMIRRAEKRGYKTAKYLQE